MTLVDVDLLYPEQLVPLTSSSFSSMLLDAAGESAAMIFEAPKTGTIDRVGFRTGTVTTGATLDVRLETVSATDGNPTGALLAAGSNAAVAVTTSSIWHEVTLTTPVAVTAGQLVALVIVNPAVSPGVLNIVRFSTNPNASLPYTALFTTVWTKATTHGIFAVRYTDGTYPRIPGVLPVSILGPAASINANSTPDEVGNRIVVPMACRVAGFYWWWFAAAAPLADLTLKLYDSTGTLLASRLVDKDSFMPSSVGAQLYLRLPTPVDLAAGMYRLTVNPASTTNENYTLMTTVASAGVMGAMPQGTNVYRTQRTNNGSWTDTSTERAWLGLWLSAIDDGAGSGGGAVQTAYGHIG